MVDPLDQEGLCRALGASRAGLVLLVWMRLNLAAFRHGNPTVSVSLNELVFDTALSRRHLPEYLHDLTQLGFIAVTRRQRSTARGSVERETNQYTLLRGAYAGAGRGSAPDAAPVLPGAPQAPPSAPGAPPGAPEAVLGSGLSGTTIPREPIATNQDPLRGAPKPRGSPRPRFAVPTVDEVRAFVEEHHLSVDPESFVSHYESNGWRVGRNPMKDWRAAVRNWARRAPAFTAPAKAKERKW